MTPSLHSLPLPSLSFSRASAHHFLPRGVRDTRWTPDFGCYGACCSMLPSLCLSVTILRPCCRDCMKPGLPSFCLTDVLNLDLQLYFNPCPVARFGPWVQPVTSSWSSTFLITLVGYFWRHCVLIFILAGLGLEEANCGATHITIFPVTLFVLL